MHNNNCNVSQYLLYEEERKQQRIESVKDLYVPFEPFKFKKERRVAFPHLHNLLREDYEFDALYERVVSPTATVKGLLSSVRADRNDQSTLETRTQKTKKSLPSCVDTLTESKKSKISERYIELFQDPPHKTGRAISFKYITTIVIITRKDIS